MHGHLDRDACDNLLIKDFSASPKTCCIVATKIMAEEAYHDIR